MASVRRYAPDYDATVEAYQKLMGKTGISRAVIVQPSFLGTDNSYMCGIIKQFPDTFRGIATVDASIPDDELDALGASGIVGIRLNLDGLPLPDFSSAEWVRLFEALRKRRWQIEVHRQGKDIPTLIAPLLDTGLDIVVDHFGRPDDEAGVNDPGFLYMMQRRDSKNLWVKLSASYRNGDKGRGAATAVKAARMLIDNLGPDRLVWGSDWPHTRHEEQQSIPATIKEFQTWIPSESMRELILESNAARLFHFE